MGSLDDETRRKTACGGIGGRMNGRSPHGDGLCAKHDAVSVQCDSDVWEGGRGGDKRKTGVAVWMVLAEWVGYRNRNGGRGGALNFSSSAFIFIHVRIRAIRIRTTLYPLPFTLCPLRCARVKRAETGLALPNAKPTESRESLADSFSTVVVVLGSELDVAGCVSEPYPGRRSRSRSRGGHGDGDG